MSKNDSSAAHAIISPSGGQRNKRRPSVEPVVIEEAVPGAVVAVKFVVFAVLLELGFVLVDRLRGRRPVLVAEETGVRAEGGVPDAQVISDTEGAVAWLRAQPWLNGKVGVFGHLFGRAADLPLCVLHQQHQPGLRSVGRPSGNDQGGAEPEGP